MLNPLARLLVLLGLAIGAGCATNAIAPAAARGAAEVRLVITNRTNRAWRITVRAVDGSAAQEARIEAQRPIEIALARGDYVIEQTLLDVNSAVLARREFPMRFPRAGDYQWELATLLSAEGDVTPATRAPKTASRD